MKHGKKKTSNLLRNFIRFDFELTLSMWRTTRTTINLNKQGSSSTFHRKYL